MSQTCLILWADIKISEAAGRTVNKDRCKKLVYYANVESLWACGLV